MPPLDKFGGTLSSQENAAAHLLRRATFGPTPQHITQFESKTVDEAMDLLFDESVPVPDPPIDPQTPGLTWLNPAAGAGNSSQENLIDYFMAWHLEQMRTSGNSIKERIVWFLHSHLPVARTKVTRSESIYYQNALYRFYAFGSFKTLFRKLCVDNAMLLYLDNGINDKSEPNENFAREMFELYTIGRGPQVVGDPGNYTNYTEQDIQAAAEVLTGWQVDDTYSNIDPDTGLPTGNIIIRNQGGEELADRHAAGQKQFSAAFQNQVLEPDTVIDGYATVEAANAELDALIDMIFEQPATAQFLVRKMYRHFVYYEITPEVESNVIVPLAETFRTNDYSIPVVLKELFSSQHFYDTDNTVTADNNMGALIKSPVDLMLGMFNMFSVDFPTDAATVYQTVYQMGILPMLYEQGLALYDPYDVAGYDAYYQHPIYNRYWITPYSLAYRYQLSDFLISGTNGSSESLGIQLDILAWVQDASNNVNPADANDLVEGLVNLMFPFPLPTERFEFFLNDVFLDGVYASAWTTEWNTYLGNPSNDTTVRNMLERLLRGLIQSPEFQLY